MAGGKVRVAVPGGATKTFKANSATARVRELLEKLYGVGYLLDAEGDSVVENDLCAGSYVYTVAQAVIQATPRNQLAAQLSLPAVDHSDEICRLLAQPFAEQVDDSVEGLRNMLTRMLSTRLPVGDRTYSRMSSSLREFFVPDSELPTDKLGHLISYAFLGSTPLRSGSSESATQALWDDLMFKPMTEVVYQSGVTGIFIKRNHTNPTLNHTDPTLPDMVVSCGELVIVQEEKKGGDLKVPTRELFEKLEMLSAMYRTSFVRRFIVGVSTAGNTVAYYALDRERRQGPVLICGPIAVGAADHSTTRVLHCSFNCLRFVLTVDAERMHRQMSSGQLPT